MLANDIEDIDCVFEDRVTTNQLNENKFYMNCTLQRAIPVFISIDDVVKVRLEVCAVDLLILYDILNNIHCLFEQKQCLVYFRITTNRLVMGKY